MAIDRDDVQAALDRLTARLLAERTVAGHWEGELSSSALSTATATIALTLAGRSPTLAENGELWLIRSQNGDGGWGDTVRSVSNISTTALCWAALTVRAWARPEAEAARARAAEHMRRNAGSLEPGALAAAIRRRYGKDRTFSVPILTVLALSGLLGTGREAWRWAPQLPFELAALPQDWYRWLRLPVVSYALPALIAIGQARHRRRPSRNPAARLLRDAVREQTLAKLREIQPSSGGFLEATPLTSFVVMSLIAADRVEHPVVEEGLAFLERSARPDGSWPIDTNLATWVTTLSVNALAQRVDWPKTFGADERAGVRRWLLAQQYRVRHPYTGAASGGWAWTDLPGGVPDADDTPGALLALRALGAPDEEARAAAATGVRWLCDLQNADGGIPTFCRGWGALPFDRSSPDLTAHTLRAWQAWRADLPAKLAVRVRSAARRAVHFLERVQLPDGAWRPLWFGNQFAPDDRNLAYGTSRVLRGLVDCPAEDSISAAERAAVTWLIRVQNQDNGWGGEAGVPSSVEETALAVSALAAFRDRRGWRGEVDPPIERGVAWLLRATEGGRRDEPSPIGFYFAKLWYFEKLYPRIFAIEALAQASSAASTQTGFD